MNPRRRNGLRGRFRPPRALGALLVAWGVAACGTGAGLPAEPFAVSEASAFPRAGATDVALDTELRVRLSAPVDARTAAAGLVLRGPAGPIPGAVLVAGEGDVLVLVPQEPLPSDERFTAEVTPALRDASGRALARGFDWSFRTGARAGDATPGPVLVSLLPADGAADVSIHVRPELRFSHAMQPASLEDALRLERLDGTPVARGLQRGGDGRTVRVLPVLPLELATGYRLRVTSEALSLAGLPLAASLTIRFTTSDDATRGAPLLVEAVTPADGETEVPPATRIVARFGRPLLASSVTTATFGLYTESGEAVDGAVSHDPIERTATFVPAARLAAAGRYRAVLDGLSSDEGFLLENIFEWSFTVSADPLRGERPEVVQTTPAAGTEALTSDTVAQVRFSKALDPATVDASTVRVRVNGVEVEAERTVAGERLLELRPAAGRDDAEYAFELTEGVRDLEGLALKPFSFSVRTARDVEAPRVTGTEPAEGATGVAPNAPLRFRLSEPCVPEAARLDVQAGGAPVAGGLAWEPATRSLVFTPDADLPPSEPVVATLEGVVDARGNAAAAFVLRFRSGSVPDRTAPVFAGLATATPLDETRVALTWPAATEEESAPVTYLVWATAGPWGVDYAAAPALTTGALEATLEGLESGARYHLAVRARDLAGNVESNTVALAVTLPDLTPPTFAGRAALAPIAGRAALAVTWSPAFDTATREPSALRYRIYGSDTAGGQSFSTGGWSVETAPGATEASFESLPPETSGAAPRPLAGGRRYYVVVRAVDAAGNESTNTAESSAVVADTTPPAFPGQVRAVARARDAVRVQWDLATDDLTPAAAIRYVVETRRAEAGAPFVASPAISGALQLDVGGLVAGGRYVFRVSARDAAGNVTVNPSEPEVLLDATPPAFPAEGSGVTAVSGAPGEATVSWRRASDDTTASDALQYLLFRAPAPADPFAAAPETVPGTATLRTVAGLAGGRWRFGVRARDALGNTDANVQVAEVDVVAP